MITTSKYRILYVLLLCIPLIACTQNTENNVPRSYVAYKTSEPVEIDGKSNELAWQQASWSDEFIDIEGVLEPTYTTRVKMLWDESYFYILAEIEEPHVWATLKQKDTIIFYNNDFEVFLDPDGDTHNYYEFEMNALNTTWDLFITKPYREKNAPILNDWNVTGLKSAVTVDGTLNDPTDTDKGWTLELAFPWAVYKTGYFQNNVPRDQYWRVNFSRVNWDFDLIKNRYYRKKDDNGNFLHEHNWVWSPQGVINMHEPEHWGFVYFSSDPPGSKTTFTIPEEEHIKRYLYRVYRAQNSYYGTHKKWTSQLNDLKIKPLILNGKNIVPEIEVHSMGWNAQAVNPFTGKMVLISQDGKSMITN
jgi:hypothetical protein